MGASFLLCRPDVQKLAPMGRLRWGVPRAFARRMARMTACRKTSPTESPNPTC
jgi:hypothetical protein